MNSGFLKAHASSFFTPALREEKIRAIEAIGEVLIFVIILN